MHLQFAKNFGRKKVLDGVSFEMDNGIYGLLGPNGAGKTTLIRIMAGIMDATSGEILMNGRKRKECSREFRNTFGYLPQDLDFYPNFTGVQYLKYVAELKGIPCDRADKNIEHLVEQVGLTGDIDRRCVTYSGGMKRRLGIAQALLNDPKILILDEPTAGLDPYERIKFRNIISIFSKDRIVLLSTHIVSDVDSVAKKVIMIKHGRIKSMENARTYIDNIYGKVWLCKVALKDVGNFQKNHVISNAVPQGDYVELRVISDDKPVQDAVLTKGNLEDAYLYEYNYRGDL